MQLPRPGDILEQKYRLEEMLGEGAYGLVVKATTLSTQRPVAVKILKPRGEGYADSQAQRFLREMRVIAKLQCPNTLTLYDFGRTAAGVLFMVTEFVEGEDLYDLLQRRGALTEKETMHVLHQCLLSLSEAHEHGVLHRDIKPHNIRLSPYGDDPLRVKVLDFGLSKSMEGAEGSTLTAAGLAVGTPRYMSPEQLTGKELGPPSDIYSLGLVAYEMLLGEPANSLHSAVGPRRRVSIDEDAGVNPHLRSLVNDMLKRSRRERYPTAAAVLAGLKLVRSGQVPPPPDAGGGYRPPAASSGRSQSAARSHEAVPHVEAKERSRPADGALNARIVAAVVVGLLAIGLPIGIWLMPDRDEPSRPEVRRANPLAEPDEPAARAVASNNAQQAPERRDMGEQAGRCTGLKDFEPGVTKLQSMEGLSRLETLVYIPDDYDPQKPHPTIWFFHDSTSKPAAVLSYIDKAELEDLGSFVIVAPQTEMLTVWFTEQEFHNAAPTLDLAREQLCLDPDRLYVWGHGFGGRVALRQGRCMDDVAAIATTNYRERFPDALCEPKRELPYLHVGATKDRVAPAAGGPGCYDHWIQLRCESDNCSAASPPLADHVRTFKKRYGCSGAARKPAGLRASGCETWACDVPFASCVVDGGRALPGVPQIRDIGCPQTEPAEFDYVRTVYEFFAQFERRH